MSGSMRERLEDMKGRLARNTLASSTDDLELTARKHDLIVEKASRVLYEKGFHGASMRDIAKACGMSFGQLYHYISSKDDILYLMHRNMQSVWYEHLVRAGFEEITDPRERLYWALRFSLGLIDQHREMFLFLYTESKYLEKSHLKLVLDMDDKNIVEFHRMLVDDVLGESADPDRRETYANLISFLPVFLALRGWIMDRSKTSLQIDHIIDFIFGGLGIPAPEPAWKKKADEVYGR